MAIRVSAMASFLLLVGFTVFLVGPSACSAQRGIVGGKKDIPNVKSDKEVQDLGRWCVDEYNRQQNGSLTFKEVVSGQTQVVAGTNYYLHILVADGGATKYLDAVVWVRAWLGSKQLISYKLSS